MLPLYARANFFIPALLARKKRVIFRQQLSRNDFLQITDECIPHRFVGISRLQAENNSDVAVGDTKAGVVFDEQGMTLPLYMSSADGTMKAVLTKSSQ